ncbi:porin family protein [Photobacterium makurazakiensis]|uniref:porin family protein n=1 Tax=Photobacterium makurazakiensis TaxID=2910234 RepID=UPI003D0F385A
MKKTIFALTIASLLSAPALASKEGFYIGADLGSNRIEGESFDTGFGLVAGYDFHVAPQVVIGVEGEYRHLGKEKGIVLDEGLKPHNAELKAHSFGINVKPKYYFNENFYAGVQLGLHSITEKVDVEDFGSDKDSGTGVSYGLEAGYDFNRNVAIKGGYKAMTAKVHGWDTDYSTLYIGANYKF